MQSSAHTYTRKLAERRVGKLLDGKWMLERSLGFGGTAAVYAASHRNGKRAAIKILHPHCMEDEQLRTRFVREGYVANKIGHPGAVSVIDDDVAEDGTVYLVMELLEGSCLDRFQLEGSPMPIAEAVRVADALLDVLAKAHALGIVHRDIKPANLFMTSAGRLKVLDFGIAHLARMPGEREGEALTQTGSMLGTLSFMPPEQARAQWDEVDSRSDLWAVGATMCALMLGRKPRSGDSIAEELYLAMSEPLPSALTLLPHLPRAIAEVIDRATAFRREDRWPSAVAMQGALREAAEPIEETLLVQPPSEPLFEEVLVTTRFVAPAAVQVPPARGSAPQLIAPYPVAPSAAIRPAVEQGHITGRHHPVATTKGLGLSVAIVVLLTAASLAAGILFFRSRGSASHRSPSAASESASAAPPSTAAESAAPPSLAVSPSPRPPPTYAGKPDARRDPKPAGLPRPSPPSSADPAKYFDSRF